MIIVLAKLLARPAIADWLIRRAMRTPYFHIQDADGSVYMERYWLFNPIPAGADGAGRRWGSVLPSIRIHRIRRADRDAHLHDHPWDARTVILRDWYEKIRATSDGTMRYVRQRGDTACLRFGEFHRITAVAEGEAWTLFVTWKKRGTWGFLVDGRKVPWRTYLGLDGAAVSVPQSPDSATVEAGGDA